MLKIFFDNLKKKDLFVITFLVIFIVLTRLIILLDVNIFIDGDEAIFGRMIKDFMNNGEMPLFFYGQNYGLVFFEVLTSAMVSLFFGANIFTMKVAMLMFWLGSMVVLYYAAKKILKSRIWAFLSIIIISSIPVWIDWSMKARGGYLTSLLLSNVVIYLSFLEKTRLRIMLISLFLVIIYYAQPLWLVILVPFIAYYLLEKFKLNNIILFFSSGAAIYFLSKLLFTSLGFQFQAQNKLGFQVLKNTKNIYKNYLVGYSGAFFDSAALNINVYLKVISITFLITLLVIIFYNIYLAILKKNKKINYILLSSVLLYVVFMLFYNEEEYAYRFLLPVFIPAALLIVVTLKQLINVKYEKYLYSMLIIFAVTSSFIGIYAYKHVYPELNDGVVEIQRSEFLGNYLNDNDVQCVYTLDWIISQHLYYFMPDIISRYQGIDPRRLKESIQVDILRNSDKCALVGLWYHFPLFYSQYSAKEIMIISSRYIVKINPSKESLDHLGFELTD